MADDTSYSASHYDDFSIATGRLFLKWADLETILSAGLRLHLERRLSKPRGSKIDERIGLAAAIYGSMRLKASRDIIKRILTHEKAGQEALDFHRLFFEQLAHIEDLRDKLAHQYSRPGEKPSEWVLVDIATTKTHYKPKAYQIDALNILAAAIDLQTATNRVSSLFPLDQRKRVDLTLPAWRYKSSMLKLLPHKKLLSLRDKWLQLDA